MIPRKAHLGLHLDTSLLIPNVIGCTYTQLSGKKKKKKKRLGRRTRVKSQILC